MVVQRVAELTVKVDARKAESEVDSLENSVDQLIKTSAAGIDIKTGIDTSIVDDFVKDLKTRQAEIKVQAQIDRQETSKLVKTLQSQIGDIEADVDLDPSEAKKRIADIKDSIKSVKIEAELNAGDARAEIKQLGADIKAANSTINVDADTAKAESAIEAVRPDQQIIDVDADTSKAESKISSVKPDPVMVDVEVDDSSLQGITDGIGGAIGASSAIALSGFTAIGVAGAAALLTGFNGALDLEVSNDRSAASLGLTPEEAEKLGSVAADTYAGAWGESIDEVNQAIRGNVQQGLVDFETDSEEAFGSATQSALDLANVLDTDVNEVTRAAGQLYKSGLADSAEEAYDLIAAGAAEGADVNGQFLETIIEFAPNWGEAGFSGEQALGQIVSGSKTATFDLTKLGDLIKETGIELAEIDAGGLELVSEATGLATDEIAALAKSAKEGDSVSFLKLVDSVKNIEDSSARSTAAVELFGVPFEDLSNSAFLETDFGAELENIDGAAGRLGDTLNDNLSTRLEALKREGFIGLSEAANEFLVPAIEAALPVLQEASAAFTDFLSGFDPTVFTNLAETFDTTLAPTLTEQILPLLREFSEIFINEIVPVVTDFGTVIIEDLLPPFLDIIATLQEFGVEVIEKIVIPAVESLVEVFRDEVQPVLEDDVVPAVEEAAQVIEDLQPVFDVIVSVVGAVVVPALEVLARTFVNVFGSILNIVTGTVQTIRGVLTLDLAAVVAGVGSIFGGLVGLVRAPLDSLVSVVSNRVGSISSRFDSGFGRIESAVDAVLSPIRELIRLIGQIPSSIPNPFANIQVPNLSGLSNIPGFAFGGITNEPTFITSEFGHEEAIFPTAASIPYIKSILAKSKNDVLGRLYDDFEANQTNVSNMTSTTYRGGSNVINVTVEDNGRRSLGERKLQASLTASAIARRLQPIGVA